MKNYLDSVEMKKVLDHVTDKLNCCNLTNLVLTANNLVTLEFLKNENLKSLESLTLSRNKISGEVYLL